MLVDPFEEQFISPFFVRLPVHKAWNCHSLYTAFSSNVGAWGMWACSLFLSFTYVLLKTKQWGGGARTRNVSVIVYVKSEYLYPFYRVHVHCTLIFCFILQNVITCFFAKFSIALPALLSTLSYLLLSCMGCSWLLILRQRLPIPACYKAKISKQCIF